jgi:hypothetical protein
MKNKMALLISTMLIFAFSILSVVSETSPAELNADEMRLEAQKYRILQDESGCRHYDRAGNIITGDGGLALGIAQFHRATFESLKKLAGRAELDIMSRDDQLWLFDWAIRNGHAHNWTAARWLAAREKPEFPIAKKYKLVKGSERCPTYQQIKEKLPDPEAPKPLPAAAPHGPVFEMPLVVNI